MPRIVPAPTDLPSPPPGRHGWPWNTEERQGAVDPLAAAVLERSSNSWPKISIVTPSYNQSRFVEETIRSVLLQNYPNLEYIIIDGGSTDGTVEIIEKYKPWLTYWVSEADGGMYDAINKGFAQATGDIMAWSNADDIYLPRALTTAGTVFLQFPEIVWLTSLWKVQWDENSQEINRYRVNGFSKKAFYRGRNLLGSNKLASFMIQQQSTFWKRTLWQQAGGKVDDQLDLAGDFELWARFFRYADLYALDEPLGVFRFQPDQKTATHPREYLREAEETLRINGGRYPSTVDRIIRSQLLGRIPVSLLQYFPFITYTALSVQRGADGNWELRKRRFV